MEDHPKKYAYSSCFAVFCSGLVAADFTPFSQILRTLQWRHNEHDDVSITGVPIVCWTVTSGTDQRKHQISELLAFVWGILRWTVNSRTKSQ